ncbi:MAG: ABC transporter ATP-binding protein [Firmicutes bacterium]|nr:ABC transporter ATP-binding protein [Bacillota bacterium]
MALLDIRNLRTSFFTHLGEVKAVDGVSFQVGEGEAVALVGESGCGKSVTALSIMGLVPPPGKIIGGEIIFAGEDLTKLSGQKMRHLRGNVLSMIFQDPMTSLNPVLNVETQLGEGLRIHKGMDAKAARARVIELLNLVGIPEAKRRLHQYPHEFSGGMRQRLMIAMALACSPKMLIADEPTTALDVTIQAQIIELLKELKVRLSSSILLITHDMGIVAGLCQRVIVMYAGRVVETGSVEAVFDDPQHPYTWGLLRSLPRLDARKDRLVPIPGQPPDLLASPQGCPFAARCRWAMRICVQKMPVMTSTDKGTVACWLQELGPQAVKRAREEVA